MRFSVRISLCRLVITVIGCIIKIVLIPFKYVIGGGRPSGGHCEFSMPYFFRFAGSQVPRWSLTQSLLRKFPADMATPDYRDPYGSRHMELT